MTLIGLDLDRRKLLKEGIAKRVLNNAFKDTLRDMGDEWHGRFLPMHFDESAYSRYGFTQRKGGNMSPSQKGYKSTYVGRKRKRLGHNRPLELTGEGRMLAMGPAKIRGTNKEARVVLPSKFNFRHPKSRISMRDEITRVLPDEARTLVDHGRGRLKKLIDRPLF